MIHTSPFATLVVLTTSTFPGWICNLLAIILVLGIKTYVFLLVPFLPVNLEALCRLDRFALEERRLWYDMTFDKMP